MSCLCEPSGRDSTTLSLSPVSKANAEALSKIDPSEGSNSNAKALAKTATPSNEAAAAKTPTTELAPAENASGTPTPSSTSSDPPPRPLAPVDTTLDADAYCRAHYKRKLTTLYNGNCGPASICVAQDKEQTPENCDEVRRDLAKAFAKRQVRKALVGLAEKDSPYWQGRIDALMGPVREAERLGKPLDVIERDGWMHENDWPVWAFDRGTQWSSYISSKERRGPTPCCPSMSLPTSSCLCVRSASFMTHRSTGPGRSDNSKPLPAVRGVAWGSQGERITKVPRHAWLHQH